MVILGVVMGWVIIWERERWGEEGSLDEVKLGLVTENGPVIEPFALPINAGGNVTMVVSIDGIGHDPL